MRNIALTPEASQSYKIGVDEIIGLKESLVVAMKPIQEAIKAKVYWHDCELESVEYKSRDGFIPHGHNCGGIQLNIVIPKCQEYDFCFVEFGDCDTPEDCGEDCICESEGHLDASLTIFLKFEGIDKDNGLDFYLCMFGGNGDAPYFRAKYSQDYFESEFSCKSVKGIKRAVSKHIKALLKVMV